MRLNWIVTLFIMVPICLGGCARAPAPMIPIETIVLPRDFVKGNLSVFDAIVSRRSVREYADTPLTLEELSTLLFTTQGVTEPDGKRAAPSAGALYPMETYAVVNNVDGLDSGLYHYLPQTHSLELLKRGEFGADMARLCVNQPWLSDAATDIVWTAVHSRTTSKYGQRGLRYIDMEAGHISENLYLQGNSIGLGVVAIGAFDEDGMNRFLGVDGKEESAVYVNAIGRRK